MSLRGVSAMTIARSNEARIADDVHVVRSFVLSWSTVGPRRCQESGRVVQSG